MRSPRLDLSGVCGVRDVHTGVVDLKGDRNRSSSCENWGFAGTILRATAAQGCRGRGRVGAGIPYGTLLYSASLTCDPVAQQNRKARFTHLIFVLSAYVACVCERVCCMMCRKAACHFAAVWLTISLGETVWIQ